MAAGGASRGTELELTFDSNENDIQELGENLLICQVLKLSNSFLHSFRDLGTQLQQLQVLSVLRAGLVDCDGVVALPLLRELYAGFNSIADVSGLALLEHLEVLDLEGNCLELSAVRQLKAATGLRQLTLQSNPAAGEGGYRATVLHQLPFLHCLDDVDVAPAELQAAQRQPPPASPSAPPSARSARSGTGASDSASIQSAASEDSVVADAVRASVSTALLHPASPQAQRLRAVAASDGGGGGEHRTLGIAVQHVLRPVSADSPLRPSRRDAFGPPLSARSGSGSGGDAFALRAHAEAAGGTQGAARRRHSDAAARRPRTAGSLPSSSLAARWDAFCAQAAAGGGGLSDAQARSLQAQLDAVLHSSSAPAREVEPGSGAPSSSTASELTHGTSSALVGNAARALRRKGVLEAPAPPSDPDAALDMAMHRLRRRSTGVGGAGGGASARRSRQDMLQLAGVQSALPPAPETTRGGNSALTPAAAASSTLPPRPVGTEQPGLGAGGGFLAMLDAAKEADTSSKRSASSVQLLSARRRAPSATSASISGRSSPGGGSTPQGEGAGDALGQTDSALIALLSQRPKHVPQLKSRDSFRGFFRGIPRLRMERLLRLAFAALEEEARDDKVHKRMALLQGVFQEDL